MIKSLKFKIILSTAACILIVGVFSNVFLYRFLTGIISDKSDDIDSLNLQTVQTRLNLVLEEMASLATLASYDLNIARGMRNTEMWTVTEKRQVLNAQESLQRYLNAHTAVEPYVNRLIIFNESEVNAQAVTRKLNEILDFSSIMQDDVFLRLAESGNRQIITVAPSIIDGETSIICVSYIYEPPSTERRGFIYAEVSPEFISEMFSPYRKDSLLVTYGANGIFPEDYAGPIFDGDNLSDDNTLTFENRIYRFQRLPLSYADAFLYSCTDITFLSADANAIFFTAAVVIVTSLIAALILAVSLGSIITKPLNRLTLRLRKISENDFSRDPAIEAGGGEIAGMGRVVNDMAENIDALLHETEDMYIRQKNSEIALLQSQVNPHFLYNTLDTIRWMAVIQKAPGIEKTVRSLSNLLKNLAKGVGDKITLAEEFSLLKDYIDTQSVRFMELLEFTESVPENLRECLIVKLTLQPLVENAIFHGIEPTGEFGRISVNAEEDGDFILIHVEDNGVGMTAEEIAGIENAKPHPAGMSGIGIANVDSRIKLIYGNDCGLTYASEQGKYTRVTVRIRKETAHAQGTFS